MTKQVRGFTLIELLITIVILAILAGITIIALNPGQNIDDANDVRRKSDVTTILNAVWQFAAKNNGTFPPGVTGTTALAIASATLDFDDFCNAIVPTYLARLPVDPSTGSYTDCATYATGYTINTDASAQRITVTGTLSDASPYSVTR